ncbi:MAG: membrane protein insertion efficiency factor YidD, partial [Burkholderiaceae bacterium]|nr:membrane protein insertion efficiency factor YidD [Burkholderiaceae bacterium]
AAVGSYLTVHRLARCHPWCDGGHDPVPTEIPRVLRLFSRFSDSTPPPPSPKKSS